MFAVTTQSLVLLTKIILQSRGRIVHCVVAKRPGGETSWGRTVQVANRPRANRPDGETSKGRNVQGAKRLGGETSWGRTDEGAKRPVTHQTGSAVTKYTQFN